MCVCVGGGEGHGQGTFKQERGPDKHRGRTTGNWEAEDDIRRPTSAMASGKKYMSLKQVVPPLRGTRTTERYQTVKDFKRKETRTHRGREERTRAGTRRESARENCCRSSPDHFSHGMAGSHATELRRDQLPLNRPDFLGEPVKQREVIRKAPKDVHGDVGVRIDQARHHHVVAQVDLGRAPDHGTVAVGSE